MMRRALPLVIVLFIWAALPLGLPRNIVDLLVFSGIYTIAGLGVSLLLGHCGIVNLAQALFYGICAYSTAYVTTGMNLSSIWGFGVGAALSMAIAFLVGWPVLRLPSYFLALA